MEIELSERLNGIGEYYFSKKLREIDEMRRAGREIISLGIGSPDRPPHSEVIAELCRVAKRDDVHGYQSYKGALQLREAFASWYKRSYGVTVSADSEILPLIGSKEGLMHICMTYLNKGDKVLIPNPGYPTYTSAVRLSGGQCVSYNLKEEEGWQPNLKEIDVKGVKMMILNYPHMPTGAEATKDTFEALVAFAKEHNILLVHDNPYSFIRNKKPQSLLAVEGAMDVAIELNSLSKSHNMAGWRVGAIFASKQRIDEILRFKSNMDSGTFLPMQLASAKALSLGEEWYKELNDMYHRREVLGYKIIELLGCKAQKGQCGLFIWGRLPERAKDCYSFIDEILENKGVFITPGGIFGSGGDRYIRISLCADEKTLEKVINIL
ncbi:MAG: aminotransferase class I/II-fold pyridoxal phosphate-dependent enzyme [Rikenellaceae bacterium]